MPRLTPFLLRRAWSRHPLLPLLLRSCHDLPSALNELRWLREHAIATARKKPWQSQLRGLALERSKGKPLQYILGSQPFGELDVLCRPGVLIPRPETETLTTHLASLLLRAKSFPPTLRVLDLCTGTGCIALLLHTLLTPHIPHHLQITGIDNAPRAISLARQNLRHNIARAHLSAQARGDVSFADGDVFFDAAAPPSWAEDGGQGWDVVISNPPYISPVGFDRTTSRSVRKYEPKGALVPARGGGGGDEARGDVFYPRLLEIAARVRAKVVVVEVADMAQASRVAGMVVGEGGWWEGCEVWRDSVGRDGEGRGEVIGVDGGEIRVLGEGNGRAVLAWTGDGARMLGRDMRS